MNQLTVRGFGHDTMVLFSADSVESAVLREELGCDCPKMSDRKSLSICGMNNPGYSRALKSFSLCWKSPHGQCYAGVRI